MRDARQPTLAALVDPFGSRAVSVLTEYWTIAERNTRLVPLEGVLLWNRLLWLGIGAAIVALCFWRFSFAETAARGAAEASKVVADPADNAPPQSVRPALAVRPAGATPTSAGAPPGASCRTGSGSSSARPSKNIYFGVLVLAGAAVPDLRQHHASATSSAPAPGR